MSLWADLRDAIRKAILLEDRVERLIVDVGRTEERLIDHDRRLTRSFAKDLYGSAMSVTKARNTRRAKRAKEKRVTKARSLFGELMQGVEDSRRHREGKITLRSHEVTERSPLTVDARVIRETREQLNVSRAVFARGLRVSARTLESWEQGRARPNAQAAALILMVRRYPDTLHKLQSLDA